MVNRIGEHPLAEKSAPRSLRNSVARGRGAAASVDAIYDRILGAIIEHRLLPGTQLVEEKLAGVFHVSRTQIRHAIARLAHDRIVTVFRNRGAFVSRPTVEEAREVFDARRVIEPDLVRRVAAAATPAQVETLRRHMLREQAAHAAGDRRALTLLTGEFHQRIAEMAGNAFLVRTLRELESLTSLIIVLYDKPQMPACACDEHAALVDAIESHDPERAAALMLEHMRHVEDSLDLGLHANGEVDLETVFTNSPLPE